MTKDELKIKLLNNEFDCMIDFWMEAEEVLKGTTICKDYGTANFSETMTNNLWMAHHRIDDRVKLNAMRDEIGAVAIDFEDGDTPQEWDAGTMRTTDWRLDFERFVFIDGKWHVVCEGGYGCLTAKRICEIKGFDVDFITPRIVKGWRLT